MSGEWCAVSGEWRVARGEQCDWTASSQILPGACTLMELMVADEYAMNLGLKLEKDVTEAQLSLPPHSKMWGLIRLRQAIG